MKRYLLIIAAIGLTTAQAQYVSNYKKAADRFYAKGDYYSASQYYEKYLSGKTPGHSGYAPYILQKQGTGIAGKHKLPSELLYHLADSYYRLNNFAKAEPWYKMMVDKYLQAYPQARCWYAVCLRAKGDYEGAMHQLESFLLEYRTYDEYAKLAHHELDTWLFIRKQLKDPDAHVRIEKLDDHINKEGASYAAGWLNNSTLVFTATRSEKNNALFQAAYRNNGFEEAEKINIPVIPHTQTGAASFTADGNRMYFTGWIVNAAGKKQSAIYSSEKNGERWSRPVLIDSNARQPQITSDGKYLLFVSDRTGTVGGYDIWYAAVDNNGRIGNITNMGPAVNTASDEEAPFYHAASNTLVFASKGRIGMGGFDLFASTGSFAGSWKEAVNLGYPVNSVKDDTYFISRGAGLLEDVIISSDRSSACCLELFFVHKDQQNIVGKQ